MIYKERSFKYVIYEYDYGIQQIMYEFCSYEEAINKLDKLNNKMKKFEDSKDYDKCDEYGELYILLEEQNYANVNGKIICIDKEFETGYISKPWVDIMKEIKEEEK